jgi:hypothetical protein
MIPLTRRKRAGSDEETSPWILVAVGVVVAVSDDHDTGDDRSSREDCDQDAETVPVRLATERPAAGFACAVATVGAAAIIEATRIVMM